MPFNFSQALGAFAGVLVLGGAWFGTAASRSPERFGTIEVERINVREPDGTLRMVISDKAREPGIIVKGHEYPHPNPEGRGAGMIFYNDEGTENGGLIFDGSRDASGAPNSSGSLTFDRYEQDQVVQVVGSEEGAKRSAGLIVNDQPDEYLNFDAIESARTSTGAARSAALARAHVGGSQRAFFGRATDGSSEIALRDAKGVKRLIVRVAADGASAIEFLDSSGHVIRTIGPDQNPR